MVFKNEEGLAVLGALAVVVLAWVLFANAYGWVAGFPWNFLYLASGFVLGLAAGWILKRVGQ